MLLAGKPGSAYKAKLAATGGVKPLTWKASVYAPVRPEAEFGWRALRTLLKSLKAKTYTFKVQVTDSTKGKHKTATATMSLNVT